MLLRSILDRVITLLGVAGFIFAALLTQQVFPSAAIDLSVPRQTIYQNAEDYLLSHHLAVSDLPASDLSASNAPENVVNDNDSSGSTLQIGEYKSVQRFGKDRMGSVYLERTFCIPETNRLIKAENLPIHYWSIRHFKPSQQEEFSTYLSTTGELIGYHHTIPEADPGESLDQDAAQAIAQNYLTAERGWDLSNWSLADASTTERPARTDHSFDWKRNDFDVGDAELRLSIGLQGDRIGDYSYWMKVPEAFSRDFREERNAAGFVAQISYLAIFYGPLSVAFIFFIIAIAQIKLNWRAGLPPAILFFFVSLLAQLNTLPLDKAYYSTTQNYSLFWIQELYTTLFYAVSTAVPIYFLWLGGVQIAKRVWPQTDMILPRSPARLKVFTQAYWRGLMMGGIGMGYVVMFYLVATRLFGSWSPMSANYSNLFSTPFPFLSPIRSGILPGISEELASRLVGIGFILLLTRQRWLALLIPGGIWAFAHLGYVSDPIYLRGIELWIPAIFLYGLFFLRFGLLTPIVGHCVYNSLLGASLLLTANDAYLVGSGVLVIVLLLAPLVPGLWQHWHQRSSKQRSSKQHLSKSGEASETPLTIRPTVEGDYEAISRFYLKNDLLKAILSKKCVTKQCQSVAYELLSLVSSEGEEESIQGVALASIESDDTATVKTVYVSPQYRRCYYGTQLLQALSNRLQQRGVTHVQADVKTTDTRAHRFWLNQNWQTISRKLHYRIPRAKRS